MPEVTFLELGGWLIQDPMTVFTDLLLAGLCGYCTWRLYRAELAPRLRRWFMAFFLLMALGCFVGGILNHAVFYLLDYSWKLPMVLLIGLSMSALQMAGLYAVQPRIQSRFFHLFRALIWLQIALIPLWMWLSPAEDMGIRVLVPHLAVGLFVFLVPLQAVGHFRWQRSGSKIMLYGLLLMLPATVVQLTQMNLHRWFNQNDLGHVLLMVPLYVFFLAALAAGTENERVVAAELGLNDEGPDLLSLPELREPGKS